MKEVYQHGRKDCDHTERNGGVSERQPDEETARGNAQNICREQARKIRDKQRELSENVP